MQYRPGVLLAILLALLGCAKEDPNERANALFVEAVQLFKDAPIAQSDDEVGSVYRRGIEKLDTIIAKYPASSLAVQLSSGQNVGEIGRTPPRFKVPSGSMMPTLLADETVTFLKFAEGSVPKRGSVVLFRLPKEPATIYIKRVIGLPGERIQMIDGLLHIEGRPVQRERAADYTGGQGLKPVKQWKETLPNGLSHYTLDLVDNSFYDNTSAYTVPPDHYFLMGDNRDNSTDSRVLSQVGYVPARNIVARVLRLDR